ncbi:MAG: hypothetical protein H7A33_00140 [Deltaproteobacteria bacterium]|nr:hypothetical protein [Deltaproteobacteria bacterium]
MLKSQASLRSSELSNTLAELLEQAKDAQMANKEILGLHLKGRLMVAENKPKEAMKALEEAMELAGRGKNHVAQGQIGFDYFDLCCHQKYWNGAYKTLKDLGRLFQDLDLVDEKIFALIKMTTLLAELGQFEAARKEINLAKNLHSAFSICASYNSKHHHQVGIKLAEAYLFYQDNQAEKSLQVLTQVQHLFEENADIFADTPRIRDYYLTQAYLLRDCGFD